MRKRRTKTKKQFLILENSDELDANVKTLIKALAARDEVYVLNGELVWVGDEGVHPMTWGNARVLASRTIAFRRYLSGKWKKHPEGASQNLISGLLAMGEWPGVKRLDFATCLPLVDSDGNVHNARGYVPAYRTYIQAPIDLPDIVPTRDAAVAALAHFEDLLNEYPFPSASARSCVTAAALSILLRHLVQDHVPFFLFDANVRGVGKSTQCDIVTTVLGGTGEPGERLQYVGDEEVNKTLFSAGMRQCAYIVFDNIDRPLGGATLDKILTEDRFSFRKLHTNSLYAGKWRAVFLGNGNNVTLCGDMGRRILISRLVSDSPHPDRRSGFKYPKLLRHVAAHRREYLTDLVTIASAYLAAGAPDQKLGQWGSFDHWLELVGGAIAWAGGPNVAECRATENQTPASEGWTAFLSAWESLYRFAPVRLQQVMADAEEGQHEGGARGDLHDAVVGLLGKRTTVAAIGQLMRKYKERWLEHPTQTGKAYGVTQAGGRAGVVLWRLVIK